MDIQLIQKIIFIIRGQRVMLDKHLAEMYGVPTKSINLAVKRNMKRFPDDFMFQLTKVEFENLRFQIETPETYNSLGSQIETLENNNSLRSQIVTLNRGRGQHSKYLPFAFTEQGVAMLSGILNSDKAINMNIAIMRAFVAIRQLTLQEMDLKTQLKEIKERIGEHDAQLNGIYDAIENLLDEKAAARKWEERDRIGFKK